MRILAVDPGEKRIGMAISDPIGMIANPLMIIRHISRPIDAATIAQIASEQQVGRIVIGQALDIDGHPTPQSRRAARLAAAVRDQTELPIVLWDESGSTQAARSARIKLGVNRQKRSGHLDELAAVIILQSYLDAQTEPSPPGRPEID
jgi:putative Holliday junction resolvase